jgi:uncharacterized membrane protein
MERMLVVVFENESQANEGARVLRQLDLDGSIAVYAHAVVVKKANAAAKDKEAEIHIQS